jgi:hypothetical protein
MKQRGLGANDPLPAYDDGRLRIGYRFALEVAPADQAAADAGPRDSESSAESSAATG